MRYVALLGRPNVGKSTLFNRLIRSHRAITHDMPGITRDRMEGLVKRHDYPMFTVIDTGGVTIDNESKVVPGPEGILGFEKEILSHAKIAIEQSTVLCLVVDGRVGLQPLDSALAKYLRKCNKPLILVINKVDGLELEDALVAEFHELGFPYIAVSAEHNVQIDYLLEEIVSRFPEEDEEKEQDERTLKIALLGRPNVGKSSLINALAGEERMIVQDYAGTTRDSVDVSIVRGKERFVFVDTAGVRRRNKIDDTVERYSVNSSIKSTTKADVSLLLVDAVEGITAQDKRLLSLLYDRKLPCIVVVNKMDCIEKKMQKEIEKDCEFLLAIASAVPILYISAVTLEGTGKILPLAKTIHKEMQARVTTGQLNKALETIITKHQPPIVKNSRPRFFYMTQAEVNPPTFVIFVSDSTRILDSYARYIEKNLRQLFAINYAPIRLHFRSSHKGRGNSGKSREKANTTEGVSENNDITTEEATKGNAAVRTPKGSLHSRKSYVNSSVGKRGVDESGGTPEEGMRRGRATRTSKGNGNPKKRSTKTRL